MILQYYLSGKNTISHCQPMSNTAFTSLEKVRSQVKILIRNIIHIPAPTIYNLKKQTRMSFQHLKTYKRSAYCIHYTDSNHSKRRKTIKMFFKYLTRKVLKEDSLVWGSSEEVGKITERGFTERQFNSVVNSLVALLQEIKDASIFNNNVELSPNK